MKVEAELTDEIRSVVEQIAKRMIEGAEVSWVQAKMVGGGWFATVTTSRLPTAAEEKMIREQIRNLSGPTVIPTFRVRSVPASAEV